MRNPVPSLKALSIGTALFLVLVCCTSHPGDSHGGRAGIGQVSPGNTDQPSPSGSPVTIPDVTHMSMDDATRVLNQRGLSAVSTGTGEVLRTVPAAGTEVPLGAAVHLYGS